MVVRKILEFPAKILREKASLVMSVDDDLRVLAKDMLDTMYVNNGVGLSANQIGVSKRIAVMNPTGRKSDELVLINPEITDRKGAATAEEGCLSIPGISAEVKRADEIEISFMGLNGKNNQIRLKGLSARILQHELDHSNGLLFINRVGFLKRKSLLKKLKMSYKGHI